MTEVRNLLVGLEIGGDISRLACYDRAAGEPVPVAVKTGTNLYAYPTVLVFTGGRDEWHIGYEAEYFAGQDSVLRLPPILDAADSGTVIRAGGREMQPYEVIAVFIAESLKMLGIPDLLRGIRGICVTTENLTERRAVAVRRALLSLGFPADSCFVQEFRESFFYFGYSRRPEITVRNMGLLRFREDSVEFFSMTDMRNGGLSRVTVDERGTKALPADPAARDEALAAAVDEWMEAGTYSGLFITGGGFSGDWAKESVRAMSRTGARVFVEDCLFVLGACCAAAERIEKKALRNRLYMGPDMVRTSVGIDVSDCGKPSVYPLIRAGRNWYEEEAECQVILDDRREVAVTAVPMEGTGRRTVRIELSGLPERPDLATRLRIRAFCTGRNECLVTAEDMGFGEMFASSGMTWSAAVEL